MTSSISKVIVEEACTRTCDSQEGNGEMARPLHSALTSTVSSNPTLRGTPTQSFSAITDRPLAQAGKQDPCYTQLPTSALLYIR